VLLVTSWAVTHDDPLPFFLLQSVLTDLISEAQQTKQVIDEATFSIQNVSHAAAAVEAKKEEAMRRTDLFETNLFGYEESESGANDAVGETPSSNEGGNEVTRGGVTSQSTTTDYGSGRQQSAPEKPYSELATNTYSYYGASSPARPVSHQTLQTAPQPIQKQPQQPTPTNVSRPPIVEGHNRQTSGFDSGFVMGGSAPPIPEPSVPDLSLMSSAARSHSSSGDYGFEDEEAFKIVEEMKRKAERAAEAARDAEAASSRLASEADELRSDTDKAEANARSLRAKAEEQKKGRFGSTKKKNMLRDAERAAEDAAEIKKRFMAVQSHAHDAATLAAETRREADRLKNEAEKAEIEMASAASLREQEKSAPQPASEMSGGYGMPPKSDYGAGAYVGDSGYGQALDQGYYGGYNNDYGQTMAPSANGGEDYNQPYGNGAPVAYNGGFGAGVMGGGGQTLDLPSPASFQSAGVAADFSNPY
jgi:hypothetical protein